MDKKRAFKQHWQERYVNKAMELKMKFAPLNKALERIGLPITHNDSTTKGIVKSNSAILKSMYGFIN